MDTCRGRLILHPLTQRCYCPRSKRSKGSLRGHIGMRPRPLRFQHPDKPRCNISGPGLLHKDKGYARTLSFLDLPFGFLHFSSYFSFSIGELVLRHHSLHSAFQTWQLAQCKLFFTIRPVPGRKGVQGATLSRREDALEAIGSISETAHARATYGISLETPLFQWQRCLAPCMPCNG